MNEQTTKLLETLADKLGTTADHLWAVLIKQAPLTGSIWLTEIILAAIGLYFAAKWITKHKDDLDEDIGQILLSIGYITAVVILLIMAVIYSPVILSAFFNPEYWALKQIIP